MSVPTHRTDCDERCNGDWCECSCHAEDGYNPDPPPERNLGVMTPDGNGGSGERTTDLHAHQAPTDDLVLGGLE